MLVSRIALAGSTAVALMTLGLTAVGGAAPAPDVPAHRHFIDVNGTPIPIGPQVCGNPDMQQAFNQFHFGVHVGQPGTFAMDHAHNRNDIKAGPC